MPSFAHNQYLETEVLTATPQRLHLLLIEAAMRFAERARRHWREGNREKAFQSLILAQDAVAKMLNGLNHETRAHPGAGSGLGLQFHLPHARQRQPPPRRADA